MTSDEGKRLLNESKDMDAPLGEKGMWIDRDEEALSDLKKIPYIMTIGVLPTCQRQHIGRSLLNHTCDFVRDDPQWEKKSRSAWSVSITA